MEEKIKLRQYALQIAEWMRKTAEAAPPPGMNEITPGLLCCSALLVAIQAARQAGMTVREWNAIVAALRQALPSPGQPGRGPSAPPAKESPTPSGE